MIRFLADENFNGRILRGLQRRLPELDVVRAQDIVAIRGADDPAVLSWAAEERRVLLTHDLATMPRHASRRVAAGRPMTGIFAISNELPIGAVIAELVLVAQASRPGEWDDLVVFLPL